MRVYGSVFGVLGFRVLGYGSRFGAGWLGRRGLEFEVSGCCLGSRAEDLGSKVEGLGFRV